MNYFYIFSILWGGWWKVCSGGADQEPNPKQIIKFVHFVGSDLEQKLFNTP